MRVKTLVEMLFIVVRNQMLVNSTISIDYLRFIFDFTSLIYFPLQFLAQTSVFAPSVSVSASARALALDGAANWEVPRPPDLTLERQRTTLTASAQGMVSIFSSSEFVKGSQVTQAPDKGIKKDFFKKRYIQVYNIQFTPMTSRMFQARQEGN